MFSQRARFERFAADMLYIIAAGSRIDPDRTERFGKQVEDVFRNPFVKQVKKPETAAEIKEYMIKKIEETLQWIS